MSLVTPSGEILHISTTINILSIHPHDGGNKILFPSSAFLEYAIFCDIDHNLQCVHIKVTYHLTVRIDPNLTQLNILSLTNFYIKEVILTMVRFRALFPSCVPV